MDYKLMTFIALIAVQTGAFGVWLGMMRAEIKSLASRVERLSMRMNEHIDRGATR